MKTATSIISETVQVLNNLLKGRSDVFFTTSFGFQSELLFYVLANVEINAHCVFIKSPLAYGGIDRHKNYLLGKYSNLRFTEIDRTLWLQRELNGSDFLELDGESRSLICRNLKREPLVDFVNAFSMRIWISGIRRDQTEFRSSAEYIQQTDFGVTKVSPMLEWDRDLVIFLMSELGLMTNNEYLDLCKANSSLECGLHL